jgi:hypothetical protein
MARSAAACPPRVAFTRPGRTKFARCDFTVARSMDAWYQTARFGRCRGQTKAQVFFSDGERTTWLKSRTRTGWSRRAVGRHRHALRRSGGSNRLHATCWPINTSYINSLSGRSLVARRVVRQERVDAVDGHQETFVPQTLELFLPNFETDGLYR